MSPATAVSQPSRPVPARHGESSREPAAGPARGGTTQGKARKRALDILFESELRGTDPLVTLAERTADADPPVRDYTKILVEGVHAHGADIDRKIVAALARGWSLPRLPRVDRNTLRIAVLELHELGVPEGVAVSEAVRLVSELSTDDSPAFVNGVLKGVIANG